MQATTGPRSWRASKLKVLRIPRHPILAVFDPALTPRLGRLAGAGVAESHQAGHTVRLGTNQSKFCYGRQKSRLVTNRQGRPSARCRREPAHPCTVSGSGACSVGVSISAQATRPHSAHKHRHGRCICMSTGVISISFQALS